MKKKKVLEKMHVKLPFQTHDLGAAVSFSAL